MHFYVTKLSFAFIFFAFFVFAVFITAPGSLGAVPLQISSLDRAQVQLNRGRPEAAIEILNQYFPPKNEFANYNFIYAQALRAEKKLYRSLEYFSLAYLYFSSGKQKELALFDKAQVYEELGFYEEAASVYRLFLKAFSKSEFSGQAHLGLANALFRTRRYNEALVDYEKAGGGPDALYGTAEALLATGDAAKAYEIFSSLARSNPRRFAESPLARYSMGEACRLLGKSDEAKVQLGTVTAGEYSYKAYFSLGLMAMQEEKNLPVAASMFQMASGSAESELRNNAFLNLAQCELQLGRTDEAIGLLQDVIHNEFHTDLRSRSLLLMASAICTKNRFMEASAILKTLLLKKDYAVEAMNELQKLMELAMVRDPAGFAGIWKFAGETLIQPGRAPFIFKVAGELEHADIDQSVILYSWIARSGPPELKKEAARKLVAYYVATGNRAEAENYFKPAALAGHDDPTLRLKAGFFLLVENYGAAEKALLSIKDLSTEDLLLLSKLMPHIKWNARSLAFVEKRIGDSNVPAVLYVSLGDAAYAGNSKVKALEFYRLAYSEAGAGAKQKADPGLSEADLKWTLYRMQSIEGDPKNKSTLDSLQNGGGLMGRYATARLQEMNVLVSGLNQK